MLNHWYDIPDGYQIIEENKIEDVSIAQEKLRTKKQNRYTSAKRDGNQAVLTKHTILCPHCRKRHPAYSRYLDMCFGTFHATHTRISRESIDTWGTPQYSFFPEEETTLIFNQVYSPNGGTYRCPYCKKESRESRIIKTVMVKAQRKSVSVICQANDLGDLFKVPWAHRTGSHITLPLTEKLVFNFKTGKVYINLYSGTGDMIAVTNIIKPEDWKTSTIYKLLIDNSLIRRLTVQAFRSIWNGTLPFSMSELTPDQLVPLCAYIGYPQSFYLKIPYAHGEYRADKSFSAIAKKIHTVQGLQRVLKYARFHQCKSVRKIVYQNPDYAFYIPEFEILYECLQNTDIFLMMFNKAFTFSLLTFLHQYRGNIESSIGPAIFFKDYARIKSPQSLLLKMENSISELQVYAVHYACMDLASRKREQKKWKCEAVFCHPSVLYSVPMASCSIADSKIDGFDFTLLKTKKQYQEAGRKLHNCLGNWQHFNNPVFVVTKQGQYVAAIEVRNNTTILHALGKYNLSFRFDSSLYSAYKKWKHVNNLVEDHEARSEDDYDQTDVLTYLDNICF